MQDCGGGSLSEVDGDDDDTRVVTAAAQMRAAASEEGWEWGGAPRAATYGRLEAWDARQAA